MIHYSIHLYGQLPKEITWLINIIPCLLRPKKCVFLLTVQKTRVSIVKRGITGQAFFPIFFPFKFFEGFIIGIFPKKYMY